MELLIMIDAAKRASAQRINAVIPYLAYSRQDRCSKPREPISAKLVAELIETAGAHRVITMDVHSPQSQGFFEIPLDNLFIIDTFIEFIKKKKLKKLCIVAPDIGAVKNAKKYASRLKAELAIIVKQRPKPEEAEATHIIGNIEGKTCIIIDDIINTGGTIALAVEELMKRKAKEVYVMATHGIFAANGIEKILKSKAKEIIITDTIPQKIKNKKLKVISVAKVFAEAIKKIHLEQRLSPMFKDWSL
jgi:ribose-phosphate pyrophosphokinase